MTEKELIRKLRQGSSLRVGARSDWADFVSERGMRRVMSIQTLITIFLALLLLVPFYA